MISKKLAKQILDICISTGGDFAEIFAENSYSQSFKMANGKVLEAVNGNTYGVGIRILKGLEEVYGYTNDVTAKGLKKYGFEVNDLYAVSAALPEEAHSDAVHFYTPMGTEAFAKQTLSFIAPALGIEEELEYSEEMYTNQPVGI